MWFSPRLIEGAWRPGGVHSLALTLPKSPIKIKIAPAGSPVWCTIRSELSLQENFKSFKDRETPPWGSAA